MFDILKSSDNLNVLGFLIRTLLVGLIIFILSKVLPKRSGGGQFSGHDFTFYYMMGALATAPLYESKVGFLNTVMALTTIYFIHNFLTYSAIKNSKFAKILFGEPIILIDQGKILKSGLRKALLPLEILFSELRQQGIADIKQVKYAVMETSGHISFIVYNNFSLATPADINLQVEEYDLPVLVVNDGYLNKKNIAETGFSEEWVITNLAKKGLAIDETYLCTLDKNGQLFYQKYV